MDRSRRDARVQGLGIRKIALRSAPGFAVEPLERRKEREKTERERETEVASGPFRATLAEKEAERGRERARITVGRKRERERERETRAVRVERERESAVEVERGVPCVFQLSHNKWGHAVCVGGAFPRPPERKQKYRRNEIKK